MAATPKEACLSATRHSQTTTLDSDPVRVGGVLCAPAGQPLAGIRRLRYFVASLEKVLAESFQPDC